VISQYLDDLTAGACESWNRFWFTPADPATLGMIRLLAGAMIVYTHWVWGLELQSFFGPTSWVNRELVQTFLKDDFVFSLWYVVPADSVVTVHCICLVILTLFAIGLFTRVTSILSFLIVVSYANRVPTALFGLDQINGMLALYLAIGPSGAACSVDNWLRRRWSRRSVSRPSVGANLAIRLIQVHMCVIYLFAGLTKLQGPAWWDGMAMWLAFANREYQTLDMLWLAESPWIVHLLTHLTIVWEISYVALVWYPLTRPIVLLLAVLLHVGIGLCMGMWTFGLIMLIGNMAFVPPEFVRRLGQRRHDVLGGGIP
jgi:hypothetical protein